MKYPKEFVESYVPRYSRGVYLSVFEYLDLKDTKESVLTVDEMSTFDVLNAYLTWNGIIGYTGTIHSICFPKEDAK